MMSIRPVRKHTKSQAAIEGAGVHLNRAFGFGEPSEFDPFLLLDDFRNECPEDYLAGFPWWNTVIVLAIGALLRRAMCSG